MKNFIALILCFCIAATVTSCSRRNERDNSESESPAVSQSSESEGDGAEYSEPVGNNTAEPDISDSESSVSVSVININKSIDAFDMRENDTKHGWTLAEIESHDTPPEAAFYGFLTFTGEVALTGTITHVNALYDGFEFVPDEESKGKILIPDGNPEKDFSVSIVNHDDSSINENISGLDVNESGEYTIVLTQYRVAYVPMMAVNQAVVSSVEKK